MGLDWHKSLKSVEDHNPIQYMEGKSMKILKDLMIFQHNYKYKIVD